MLRKDNLLDEELARAQDTIHTSEEKAELVERGVDRARTGVARLMAEMRSVSHKLRQRVRQLERQADKLDAETTSAASP